MNITIVGLGVIGGSYAMALNELGEHNVYAIDNNIETLKKGEESGIIKKGYISGEEILSVSDMIILCIYPSLVAEFMKKNINYFKPGVIVTDVTGIKHTIYEDIIKIIDYKVDFIFGHPMAGREKRGIDYASSEVFKGANYILTPHAGNLSENLDIVENLAYKMGFKSVKRITIEEHDKIISFTSQLPHVLAVALINSDNSGLDTGSFIGDSFRDLTRIANINGELWSELFLGNRENLLEVMEEFERHMLNIKNAIKEQDKEKLISIFAESSRRREKL